MLRNTLVGLAVILGVNLAVMASAPRLINYQGALSNPSGDPVADGTFSIVFTIYDADVGGDSKWTEAQEVSTVNGQFLVLLGSANPIEDTVFNENPRYLGVKVGTDPEINPRVVLLTVPWAFRVNTVDGAGGGNITSEVSIGSGHVNTGVAAFVAGEGSSVTQDYATVGGGEGHVASGQYSTVGGGNSNTASEFNSVVSGGGGNFAAGRHSTVAGGVLNQAQVDFTAVGGGVGNIASDTGAVVSGGISNTANGLFSTVAGGMVNLAVDSGATVSGGWYNHARGRFSVVAGGGGPTAADSNSASGDYSVIGGGQHNVATDSATTIGGGSYNYARGRYATVAGGGGSEEADSNLARGPWSSIGGGRGNNAGWFYSTVSGGYLNTASVSGGTVSGGVANNASGLNATIGGGGTNYASALYATVPGGGFNTAAGDYSFAAGGRAMANHHGSVVITANAAWSASDSIRTGGMEQMVLFADSGLYITNVPEQAPYDPSRLINTSTGAYLTSGGVWTNGSDRNLKENFAPVDDAEVLEKISELPISEWNYKEDDESVRHIGPVAQDFYATFGLGGDEKAISTIDPAGVALAAIKALNEQNRELKEVVKQLQKRLTKLENDK